MRLSVLAAVATIVGLLIAVALPVGSLAWWASTLSARVETLETKVQAIAIAPAISRPGEAQPVANPLLATCADLARRGADGLEKGLISEPMKLGQMMDSLGCNNILKR